MLRDTEGPIRPRALPRGDRRKARRVHSGQSAYTIKQRVVEVGSLGGCRISGIREAQVHRDHVLRDATHVCRAQPFIALEQQSGANEQDHSQSDFDRKQHPAQRGPSAAPAHRARCLMQRAENALVADAEGSDEAGKQGAQHDNADRKRRHHAINVDGLDAAHVVASLRKPLKRSEGEQKSQHAAGGRKQQALYQPLAYQT